MNLTNFGIDQNFVQRYHAAESDKAAGRSVWFGSLVYIPVALMFFFIGSILFSYYEVNPEFLDEVKMDKAIEQVAADSPGLAKGSPEGWRKPSVWPAKCSQATTATRSCRTSSRTKSPLAWPGC